MTISFENKVALVTGAASGLGLATAKAFAQAGASVVLADSDDAAVQAAADALNAKNHKALAIRCGVWSCMKFELQQMRKQGSGAIVNCSSIGGIVGGAGRGTYHAAKYGVLGLTTSTALDYAAHGIRVNAVCPGLFDTPMSDRMKAAGQTEALNAMMKDVPIGRLGRPEELADTVLWLCSSKSSLVVGHALVVDGGYTIHKEIP